MNILIATDKFKGSLTAREACTAIASGLQQRYPNATIRLAPLADGGDGTLAVLGEYLHLRPRQISTVDPLGRPLMATYLESDGTAYIELATASGLVLLQPAERNPLRTSTYGTGLQLRDALDRGIRKLSLLLGGSATHDLGLGIAEALGVRFLDAGGLTVRPTGGRLPTIRSIEPPAVKPWEGATIELLCDVDNPLYGPRGAARVYGAQKGASPRMVEQLEAGAEHLSALLMATTGVSVAELPGGGAAGGIGAGLVALLGARMTGGFAFVSELSGLHENIDWADVVVSGEGQVDDQSWQGKVVGGVLEHCRRAGKPLHLLVGRNALPDDGAAPSGVASIRDIMRVAPDTAAAVADAARYLRVLAGAVAVVDAG
ncbi:Glycerate 3-kinase [Neolewinella maritima]|uniref:Glycerate 3-kinase n=1 Tax=Neolewinella maritima TaxID=1383882 RepID=A0ABN8EZB0_9BACT|nr:glycerate kinase [Neolewinella maritima]CAH0999182.1 Glycerate 3-kinase [Neolewinella maritima]